MSNISEFFSPSAKSNREFITGPSTRTWPVPPGVSELEIHVWGGGGSAGANASGGGGGGYSRAKVNVTPTDSLSITVGGSGEGSTVSIPTQSPSSPIFGGGGTPGCAGNPTTVCCVAGQPGGVGIATLSPVQPQNYCFSATGGTGGARCGPAGQKASGGGGSAGSPYGNGKNGGSATSGSSSSSGATILTDGESFCVSAINLTAGTNLLTAQQLGTAPETRGQYDPSWFNINENIAGEGGAGGGGYSYICGPGGTYLGAVFNGQPGGFLAGGGGGMVRVISGTPSTCWCAGGGNGGIGGGAGGGFVGSVQGGPGAVIIYY